MKPAFSSFKALSCLLLVLVSTSSSNGEIFDGIKSSFSDFTSAIANNFNGMTTKAWQSLKQQDLSNIGTTLIQEALAKGGGLIPQRVKDMMQSLIQRNMTVEQALGELSRTGDTTPRYIVETYLNNLPPCENWNKTYISNMGNGIYQVPDDCLLRVKDKEALKDIKSKIDSQVAQTPVATKPMLKDQLLQTQASLLIALNGSSDGWNEATFKAIPLEQIPYPIFMKIRREVLATRKEEIKNYAANLPDQMMRKRYLMILADIEDLKSKSSADAYLFASKLGNLQKELSPGLFSTAAVANNPDLRTLLNGICIEAAKAGTLSPDSVVDFQRRISQMEITASTDLNTIGKNMIGLALPNDLQMAIRNQLLLNDGDVKLIADTMRASGGPLARANFDQLAQVIEKKVDPRNPVLSQINPGIIEKMSPTLLSKVAIDAKNILGTKDYLNLDQCRMNILAGQLLSSDLTDLKKEAKEMIPLVKVDTINADALLRMSQNLMCGTVITMVAADKQPMTTRQNSIMPNDVNGLLSVLPFIGAPAARKFNTSNIMESLKIMKDVNPCFPACRILANHAVNFTRSVSNGWSEGNAIQSWYDVDMNDSPVCVVAAYGPDQLSKLTDQQKRCLLMRFGMLQNIELSIMRESRMAIVREGLNAMGSGSGLQPGYLEYVGYAVADVPSDILGRTDENVKYYYLTMLNRTIMVSKMKPCLDQGQRTAIAQMIKDVKGRDLPKWDTVNDFPCLMYLLDRSDLDQIRPEVIMSIRCDIMYPSPSTKIKEALCKSSIGESDYKRMMMAEEDLRRAQEMGAAKVSLMINTGGKMLTFPTTNTTSNRTKRQTSSSMNDCERAAYGGANVFTRSEIESIDSTSLFTCLKNFGWRDMDQYYAETLAAKVRSVKGIGNLNSTELRDLGFIFKGFSSSDIQSLPVFKYEEHDDVVAMLGMKTIFSDAMVTELAKKAKQWRTISLMFARELTLVNNLICGFESADINSITKETFMGAMVTLSNLDACPITPALDALASKAVQIYGPVPGYDRSLVAELGVIACCFIPEQIHTINPEAMEGFTASAVEKLDSDNIQALGTEQILNMNPSAAYAFSDNQKSLFTPAMKKALENARMANRSKAAPILGGNVFVCFSIIIGARTIFENILSF